MNLGLGRLAARAVIGGLFVGHGTQKLFGWFDGPGLAGTEQMMEALEMRPTKPNAMAAGLSESLGGAMIVTGYHTPLAAASLIGTMTTAIRKVHQPQGPWVSQGGWEYNAVLIAALTALVETGPGAFSFDAIRGKQHTGTLWALAALGVGVAASTAAVELGKRGGPAPIDSPSEATSEDERVVEHAVLDDDTAGDPVTAATGTTTEATEARDKTAELPSGDTGATDDATVVFDPATASFTERA